MPRGGKGNKGNNPRAVPERAPQSPAKSSGTGIRASADPPELPAANVDRGTRIAEPTSSADGQFTIAKHYVGGKFPGNDPENTTEEARVVGDSEVRHRLSELERRATRREECDRDLSSRLSAVEATLRARTEMGNEQVAKRSADAAVAGLGVAKVALIATFVSIVSSSITAVVVARFVTPAPAPATPSSAPAAPAAPATPSAAPAGALDSGH